MRELLRLWGEEKGAAILIVTLSLSFLLGMVALVTDVGLLYLNRSKLSILADSAALAGVQEIPKGLQNATAIAEEYALTNGAVKEELELTGDPSKMSLSVKARRKVDFLFAKVLGIESSFVEAKSTAQAGYLTAAIGAVPLGIEEQNLDYGRLYNLKTGSPPTLGAGEFGALVLASPGADDYEKFLKEGYSGEIKVGQVLNTQTGNISNPTRRAIEDRLLRDTRIPKNTNTDFDRDAPQILLVPIYKPYEVNSNQIRRVQITGFAAFFVTSVASQGHNNMVNGYFIRMVYPGDSSFGQADYGVMGVKLINN